MGLGKARFGGYKEEAPGAELVGGTCSFRNKIRAQVTGITGYNESFLFLIVKTWPFATSQAVSSWRTRSLGIYG